MLQLQEQQKMEEHLRQRHMMEQEQLVQQIKFKQQEEIRRLQEELRFRQMEETKRAQEQLIQQQMQEKVRIQEQFKLLEQQRIELERLNQREPQKVWVEIQLEQDRPKPQPMITKEVILSPKEINFDTQMLHQEKYGEKLWVQAPGMAVSRVTEQIYNQNQQPIYTQPSVQKVIIPGQTVQTTSYVTTEPIVSQNTISNQVLSTGINQGLNTETVSVGNNQAYTSSVTNPFTRAKNVEVLTNQGSVINSTNQGLNSLAGASVGAMSSIPTSNTAILQ
jgi:hypothetical protein